MIRPQQPQMLSNELTSGSEYYLFPLALLFTPKTKWTEFTPQGKHWQPTLNLLVGSVTTGLVS